MRLTSARRVHQRSIPKPCRLLGQSERSLHGRERGAAAASTAGVKPETEWETFLQVTAGELTQADAARKWGVDVSTVIGVRRTVKDAALAALARKPGRPARSGTGPWRRPARRSAG